MRIWPPVSRVFFLLLLPLCPVRFAGVFCGRASAWMLLRFTGASRVRESLGRVPGCVRHGVSRGRGACLA